MGVIVGKRFARSFRTADPTMPWWPAIKMVLKGISIGWQRREDPRGF